MFHHCNDSHIKRKKNRVYYYVFIFLFAVGAVTAFLFYQKLQQEKLLAAEKKQLTKIIKSNSDIQSSIAVINIRTGQSFVLGSTKAFNAASTTKIILAACLLHEVEMGKKSLSIQLGAYPASFQLQQMVQQSNDDSWHELTDYVGLQTLSEYAESISVHYDVTNNAITAQDEALFLQKLYSNKLLTSQDTQLLLSYMQDTNDNSLIPSAVPPDVTIYHKYGWLDNDIHDAAILVYNNTPVILVVYTSGNTTTVNKQLQFFKPVTKVVLQYELGITLRPQEG